MSLTPLVSVGLFVYNGERFLEESLQSILNQTFTAFELIISDNASTDRTGEIAQAYAKRDDRIRYYRSDKNMGAGWNARRLYELATGKYFKWAAVDELLEWWDPARTRDLTFPEFRQLLEYFLSIYRAPLGAGQKLQISSKKSLHAAERDRPDVAEARRTFICRQPALDPDHLVFIVLAAVFSRRRS